ncbi:protein-methionine-sulfoxide reductase catalytic subunit MsrP [Granulicella sp. WH15]|uniref:protein-methionine-sulfoxide reductase catalytic subunit MsrP n=1 Tax=Granulicella sp. WH15 TaxID=2602070 RepID=UPI0013675038|nr:protein-methionine-sulfoxide reductase catalytic subunit MsrP [Granulicella sp. WH15]QHN04097.1 protein-methionine-sulfoxide reductase catalytic subunit MsrP [Granulicella sp. WH15]
MLLRTNKTKIASSEITPESAFRNRRQFLTSAATLGAGAIASSLLPASAFADALTTFPSKYTLPDALTPIGKAAAYNNFYEFGTEKSDPAHNAHTLQVRPWTIQVAGLVKKPLTVGIDDLLHYRPIESRVYRHRCVEAWSMVIPWDGYSLSEFINFCNPLPSAKYVQFISNINRKQMPDLPSEYNWPYSEGLRMDEAMHPLALLCFGCYGQTLPNQNGAPVRVVLPWKWGYKSAKSIVKIVFTDKQPRTLWNDLMPEEYGFYSNVNPNISHRWSQAHERRIDSSLLPHTIPTQMFNGYGNEVASLYNGMDLKRYY